MPPKLMRCPKSCFRGEAAGQEQRGSNCDRPEKAGLLAPLSDIYAKLRARRLSELGETASGRLPQRPAAGRVRPAFPGRLPQRPAAGRVTQGVPCISRANAPCFSPARLNRSGPTRHEKGRLRAAVPVTERSNSAAGRGPRHGSIDGNGACAFLITVLAVSKKKSKGQPAGLTTSQRPSSSLSSGRKQLDGRSTRQFLKSLLRPKRPAAVLGFVSVYSGGGQIYSLWLSGGPAPFT